MFETDDTGGSPISWNKPRANQSAWDRMEESPTKPRRYKRHEMDSEAMEAKHSRLIGLYRRELVRQEENRRERAKDFDFYDGIQMSEEMRAHLLGRGQTPLTFNVIANVVNWMLGTERRNRTDYKILPRTEEASKPAERKSQLLKYLSDVNRTPFAISRAFADGVKGGLGWIEDGVQEEEDGEPIYTRYESWRNIIHDSAATELDLSDARYIFRAKWVDVDTAISMFPDRKGEIERAAISSLGLGIGSDLTHYGDEAMDSIERDIDLSAHDMDAHGHQERERVRLIEAWYRVPVEEQFIRGGQFSGELYDSKSNGHITELLMGRATVARKVKMRMHVAIMTETGMLFHAKSPYRHNRFPFTPVWCYRRDRDNMPYGLVRQMRDPQFDVNARAAKALHILNSSKVIMDKGAVDDMEAFEEEVARPDGILVKNPGKDLVLNAERGLEQAHLDLMSRSIQLIQSMTGVTDENMGRTTNATSGKAIIARQDQGSLATAPIFDMLRLARQVSGEKQLSLIEQFMTEGRQFRITNTRGNPEFVQVNGDNPDDDIVSTKADFVITEDDFAATIRQAQVEELMNLMVQLAGTSPELVAATLDLVVETMDVPQREELVKRIRQITGQSDPDEDPNNPSPETIQRQQAAQAQQQMQQAMFDAELRGKQADAAKKEAEAEKIASEQRRILAEVRRIIAATEGESVQTQVKAMEAAARLMEAPHMAASADAVLDAAGFQDRSDIAIGARQDRAFGTQPMPTPQPAPQPPMEQPANPQAERMVQA